jgi:hypothetical protein
MGTKLSNQTRRELLEALRERYRNASKIDKTKILDEFIDITGFHGLHYIGDKLGLIARAASWLADEGRFVATLDLANLKLADGRAAGRKISSDLRRAGLGYDRRKRLVSFRGRDRIVLPYHFLGADDQAGPNYTGQPAVDSYYQPLAVNGPGPSERSITLPPKGVESTNTS